MQAGNEVLLTRAGSISDNNNNSNSNNVVLCCVVLWCDVMWCNGTKIYMFLAFFYLYKSYLLGGLGAKMWWKTFDQSRTVIWTLFLKITKWWENFYTIWCSIHKTDKMFWMSIATTIKKERNWKEKEKLVKSWKFDNPRNGEGWWLPFYNSIDFSISVFFFLQSSQFQID